MLVMFQGFQKNNHLFMPMQYLTATLCHVCQGLLWGVGQQGFQCNGKQASFYLSCKYISQLYHKVTSIRREVFRLLL